VSVRGKVIEQINGKEADDHIDKNGKEIPGQGQIPWTGTRRRAPIT
jgi:hypothetical protein